MIRNVIHIFKSPNLPPARLQPPCTSIHARGAADIQIRRCRPLRTGSIRASAYAYLIEVPRLLPDDRDNKMENGR